MSGRTLAVRASGMMTGVGLSAPAACAAIRCGLNNFAETRFMGGDGEWLVGSEVPLDPPWRGRAKLVHLAAPAIRECLDALEGVDVVHVPLLLCVAEPDRPGRFDGIEDHLFEEIQDELGVQFHRSSKVVARGRTGGALAVKGAADLIYRGRFPVCIVAGVDTYLVAGTLAALERNRRLLTSENSNGFIPGEAGAAVLLGPPTGKSGELQVVGTGFGKETATILSEEPLRAEGMVQAIKAALTVAGLSMGDLDFRITDVNGEQYGFKEAALALSRILRVRKEEFDIWHPVECVGEIGAAIVPLVLGVALAGHRKDYLVGPKVLCHFANDDGDRAAIVLQGK